MIWPNCTLYYPGYIHPPAQRYIITSHLPYTRVSIQAMVKRIMATCLSHVVLPLFRNEKTTKCKLSFYRLFVLSSFRSVIVILLCCFLSCRHFVLSSSFRPVVISLLSFRFVIFSSCRFFVTSFFRSIVFLSFRVETQAIIQVGALGNAVMS